MAEKINNVTLDSVLDQVEQLPLDDQILLTIILRKRLIEEKRKHLTQSIREGIAEYKAGLSHGGSVEDWFNELENEE
jgi:hypothetical protein